jgi:hypothetical protein
MAVAKRRVIEAHPDLRKWIATDVAKKATPPELLKKFSSLLGSNLSAW